MRIKVFSFHRVGAGLGVIVRFRVVLVQGFRVLGPGFRVWTFGARD